MCEKFHQLLAVSWNSTGEIGRIGRHRAEKPDVEVTVGLGPMPPDASDFPGGIPAVGRWFPPGTPVSSTRKLISSSSFHRLDMPLAVAEALNPNKPNQPCSRSLRRDNLYSDSPVLFYIKARVH